MRRLGLLACLVLAACGEDPQPTLAADPSAAVGAEGVEGEVARLAGEVRELADRAADFAGSHNGMMPARLADLAVDSLTKETARALVPGEDSLRITVAWRRPSGHALLACTGGPAVIEEAMLNSGRFSVRCARPTGGDTLLQAQER